MSFALLNGWNVTKTSFDHAWAGIEELCLWALLGTNLPHISIPGRLKRFTNTGSNLLCHCPIMASVFFCDHLTANTPKAYLRATGIKLLMNNITIRNGITCKVPKTVPLACQFLSTRRLQWNWKEVTATNWKQTGLKIGISLCIV